MVTKNKLRNGDELKLNNCNEHQGYLLQCIENHDFINFSRGLNSYFDCSHNYDKLENVSLMDKVSDRLRIKIVYYGKVAASSISKSVEGKGRTLKKIQEDNSKWIAIKTMLELLIHEFELLGEKGLIKSRLEDLESTLSDDPPFACSVYDSLRKKEERYNQRAMFKKYEPWNLKLEKDEEYIYSKRREAADMLHSIQRFKEYLESCNKYEQERKAEMKKVVNGAKNYRRRLGKKEAARKQKPISYHIPSRGGHTPIVSV